VRKLYNYKFISEINEHTEPVWLHVRQQITATSMLFISVHEFLTQHAEYFTCLLLMRRSIYWLPKFNPYSRPREIKSATLILNELNIAPALLHSEWGRTSAHSVRYRRMKERKYCHLKHSASPCRTHIEVSVSLNYPTPRSRALLVNLTVAQIFEKFLVL
jgi:hypothetical protein